MDDEVKNQHYGYSPWRHHVQRKRRRLPMIGKRTLRYIQEYLPHSIAWIMALPCPVTEGNFLFMSAPSQQKS